MSQQGRTSSGQEETQRSIFIQLGNGAADSPATSSPGGPSLLGTSLYVIVFFLKKEQKFGSQGV